MTGAARAATLLVSFLLLLLLSGPTLADAGGEMTISHPALAGEICVVCQRPVMASDWALTYRGRRIVLHDGECRRRWESDPAPIFASLQPRGALFQEHDAESPSLISGWFLIGVYIVIGVVCGAICAYGAVGKGRAPLPWFLAGFVGNLFAVVALASRPSLDTSSFPGGVPEGLAKVPVTRPPALCPRCGSANHPSASMCLDCGSALEPVAASETARA